jgi:hypothetical protein
MDHERPLRSSSNPDRERYYDDSDDLAARVRRARAAFQREIDAFGDPSEYEIRKIYGQRTDIKYDEEPSAAAASAAPEDSKTASEKPSPKGPRDNADRQTTLEFGSGEPQGEEQ